jgi:putative transposase
VLCQRRQRSDFHHQVARTLVRHDDVSAVEAIQPATLSRRPAPTQQDEHGTDVPNGASQQAGLNQRVQDAGWRQFLSIRVYTAACAGKRVDAGSPASTSQECSGCGKRMQLCLRVLSVHTHTHVCTTCGLMLDRDESAASTMLWRGQSLRGFAGLPAGRTRDPVAL